MLNQSQVGLVNWQVLYFSESYGLCQCGDVPSHWAVIRIIEVIYKKCLAQCLEHNVCSFMSTFLGCSYVQVNILTFPERNLSFSNAVRVKALFSFELACL